MLWTILWKVETMNKKIEEFAINNGYKTASFLCERNGYDCYEPIVDEDVISFVGLPLLILVDKQGHIRMSTPEEALQQIADMD